MPSRDPKLEKLLSGVAGGDEVAFAELYQATSSKLLGVAIRILCNRELAEEVLQEAFFKVWERAGDYNSGIGSPITWMATIVRNRALDEARRRVIRPSGDESELENIASGDEHPIAALERAEDVERLLRCLDGLEPEKKEIVRLAYLDGLSREALATRFNRPEGTIKTWLHRSLALLKGCPRAMTELDDIEGLAAEYVLGTLSREERQAVAERRAADKALDRAIAAWENRLGPLVETVAPVAPSPNLYNKIRAQIGLAQHVVSLKAREQSLARRANRWRNAFAGATALAASLAGVLVYREAIVPKESTQYVAVLDAGSDKPAFLLTVDTKTKMCVITAVNPPKQTDKTYQVWMVSDKMPKPKSLGMVKEPGEMQMMPMRSGPEMDLLMNASFAVSVEPMGGSPTGLPTGPVLFTGKLVQATP